MGGRTEAASLLRLASERHLPEQGWNAGAHQHQYAFGQESARRGDGISANQPPAGLPHLRSGRRMRPAGSGHGLWPCRLSSLQGKQAGGRRQIHGAADQDDHDPLHPVHALCTLCHRSRRGAGIGRNRPRRRYGDHDVSRTGVLVGIVRECGRSLSRGGVDLTSLRLQCAAMGTAQDPVGRCDGCTRGEYTGRFPWA